MNARPTVELLPSRSDEVGDITVTRLLPGPTRRTIGAWCFVDHMDRVEVDVDGGIDVGPHPHIGLQTVTWLIDGEVRHRDSLGYDQVIRPGQLNLMTSAGGISHAEERTGTYAGPLEGVQLWVALPEHTRHGEPQFHHHADLPTVALPGATATVLMGTFHGHTSPARHDTPLVGADLQLHGSGAASLTTEPEFEYGLVVVHGQVTVDGVTIDPEHMAYLGGGRDQLAIETDAPARVVVIGGEPFAEKILMWNNYVARDPAEIDQADADWLAANERFGQVDSDLARHDVLVPPWRHH